MRLHKYIWFFCFFLLGGLTSVYSQLQADFSHIVLSNPSCMQPTEAAHIQLKSNSSGTITNYEWFTNQASAAQVALGTVPQNPILNLNLSGGILPKSVLVTLVVHDSTGATDSISKSIDTDFHFAPIVSFSPRYAATFCKRANLELTNVCTSPMGVKLAKFKWDFGDGESSTAPNPRVSYKEPGEYTVELYVTDETGCTSSSKDSGVFLNLTLLSRKECCIEKKAQKK